MKMNIKFTLVLLIAVLMSASCGDPNEAMNKTMADFSEKCLQEEYDCECYAEKVKDSLQKLQSEVLFMPICNTEIFNCSK